MKTYNLRKVEVIKDFNIYAEGSCLITVGNTKVLCNASIEDRVPPFLKGQNKGWITAEYQMIPRAGLNRSQRESTRGKVGGRTQEIQRLIGRSLRAIVDLEKIGEKTITIDCDVLQADGGTRTASITGGFIALKLAINKLLKEEKLTEDPLKEYLAAISVGIVDGEVVLDLDYEHDFKAGVDMNVVMTESNKFVEIQGTGEEDTYSREDLNELLDAASIGIKQLIEFQKEIINE